MKAWWEKERLEDEIVNCRTIILSTAGCNWRSCRMCSYYLEANPKASSETILKEFRDAYEKADVVKIFTSGSFFDEREVDKEVRRKIYEFLEKEGVKKLVVESRPEFITEEVAKEIEKAKITIEVGIGVETSNDWIREKIINKGFSFQEFKRAASMLKDAGGRVKAYLLLKPPLLSEKEAIRDAVQSMKDVKSYVDVISLNLMTVHKKTIVERLWSKKLYRPPWLWSAVEVLKKTEIETICDPVAGGKSRGPHNCYNCDPEFVEAIKSFSLTQDKSYLEEVECDCEELWEVSLKGENLARLPIFVF